MSAEAARTGNVHTTGAVHGGGGDADGGAVDDETDSGIVTRENGGIEVGAIVLNADDADGVEALLNTELVLDVLNDDLIAQVKEKITRKRSEVNCDGVHFDIDDLCSFPDGGKELFEACVVPVKSFLAGDPFSEFEQSMYFHRYVSHLSSTRHRNS